MKQRTGSDGIKLVIPDKKLTRRLDALTKYAQNQVKSGCVVTANGDAEPSVVVSAGTFILGNNHFALTQTYVGATTAGAGAIPSYPAHLYGTIYVPSGKTTATGLWTASTAALSFAPHIPSIGNNALLLAHVKIRGANAATAQIDMQVQPRLGWDITSWDKHVATDTGWISGVS